ncbi:hypothetical protein [Pseudobacillus badius]|uniref:hypothetical protein n=1 Tax=Bacillus badius TaxID=1455 RepID=UPI0007B09ABB|nr:hypothetical protein [Bacillus badius]KZO00211.1 hypothetical protein A4244_04780 [Bacillus badius]OCS86375.1 hypothetical protein A6M11_04775 [Bacillus badius]OVE52162.1 hypothetical protein B1A98_07095 [Bacillus badius]TDW03874.1 hypothetical protein B0G66_103173 [Bacillus badius]
MNWFTIGSLTVPASQLAFLAACIMASLAIWLKKDKPFLDFYMNAVFLFIAVWKGSVVLFSFPIVMNSPLALLYFDGGWKGVWLGFLAVIAYAAWKCPLPKQKQAVWSWMVMVLAFEAALALLTGQAGIAMWFRLAGGLVLLFVPLKQAGRTIWLFTLWQLLFGSMSADLLSQANMIYIAAALFFTLMIRRDFVG